MKLVSRLLSFLFMSVCLLLFSIGAGIYLAVDKTPDLPELAPPNAQQAQLAKTALEKLNQSLMKRAAHARLDQRELDALAKVACQTVDGLSAYSLLQSSGILIQLSLAVPKLPYYLNLSTELLSTENGMQLEDVQLGDLTLPARFVKWATKQIWLYVIQDEQAFVVDELLAISRIDYPQLVIAAQQVGSLKLNQRNFLADLNQLFGVPTPVKLAEVQAELNRIHQNLTHKGPISLATLSHRLMNRVAMKASPEDAMSWNESFIWALAINYGNPRFQRLLPDVTLKIEHPSVRHRVVLAQRRDLAQHFLYSALLELLGGSSASFTLGELKELSDSLKGGSGFSFADLAADRAGIAFSKQLTDSSHAWLSLLRLASSREEHMFFPVVNHLKEGISDHRFKSEYGDIRSEEYRQQIEQLDGLISALPLYQPESILD